MGLKTRGLPWLLATAALLAIPVAAGAASLEQFRAHLQALTADGGVWVASNSQYQTDQEPFDAYKMEWRAGIGGHSAYGRMTALRGVEETPPIWEFRIYWDPEAGEGRILQFGRSGLIGTGTMTVDAEGNEETVQTFHPPGGESYRVRHTATLEGDLHETTSYQETPEGWQANRTYNWVRRGAVTID